MSKPFSESFHEWVNDDRYRIGEDVGWEYADQLEAGPTSDERSSTQENGSTDSIETLLLGGETS